MSEPYWRGAAEDEAMQDEHGFLWRALLDTIDIDLAGRRVLDAGCNRGGFLRLLVDESGIAEGYGYDPASGAIDDARRLAGQRPLRPSRPPTRCLPDGPSSTPPSATRFSTCCTTWRPTPRRCSPRSSRGRRTRGDGGPRREPPDVGVARLGRQATLRCPGCMTSTRWSRSSTVRASRCPSPGSRCGSFPSRHDEADMSIGAA